MRSSTKHTGASSPSASSERLTLATPLWRWAGQATGNWHFLTVTGRDAEAIATHALIRRLELGQSRGFGSVRVQARIGDTCWSTSVFPQKDDGWLLPVKASVRKAESLAEGDKVTLELHLL